MAALKYPIYIPSRGRADRLLCRTATLLEEEGAPFWLVVEPQEAEAYGEMFGRERILVLPFRDRGSVTPARNWIKRHAQKAGAQRHWQLDDNIRQFSIWNGRNHRKLAPTEVMCYAEEFVDRYENVAIAGLRSSAYAWNAKEPFKTNQQVYCVVLVDNGVDVWWRGIAEDTDYSLQVLVRGLCTILFSALCFEKLASRGKTRGGNTDTIYAKEGRLATAKDLKRRWPGLVNISRRYGELRMELGSVWRKFDQKLRRAEQ